MKINPRSKPGVAGFPLVAMALFLTLVYPLAARSQELQKPASEVQQSKEQPEAQISFMANPQQKEDVPVTKPPTPAPTPQESGSKFTVFGHVMLDSGYDVLQADPLWFDVARPTKLPSFPDEFAPDGTVFFGVRQTRFGVKSSTPTRYGDLKTWFEFELFGVGIDAGQTTFRLRHAYGELGHWGAGQTWSAFMDIDVFPNSLEYWGPNGMVFFRNVQLRWMPVKSERNDVTIALERPGATADQGVFTDRIELTGIRPKFNYPDLTGHVRFTRDWGYFQGAGIVRRIAWVDVFDDNFDLDGHAVGAGLSLSSNVNFSKNNIGRFEFVYGKGIENYMNDAPVDVGIERSESRNPRRPIKGVALPMWSMVAFLDHNWSKRFSTSVGYSSLTIDNSEGQRADAFHRGQYALINLLYYPVDNVTIGGEVQWIKRYNFLDDFKPYDVKVQFSFKYLFSKEFTY